MVAAEDSATSLGHREATFAVLMPNGDATFLDHKGLANQRPAISRRTILGLRDAGLFRVVSETSTLLRVISRPKHEPCSPNRRPPRWAGQSRLRCQAPAICSRWSMRRHRPVGRSRHWAAFTQRSSKSQGRRPGDAGYTFTLPANNSHRRPGPHDRASVLTGANRRRNWSEAHILADAGSTPAPGNEFARQRGDSTITSLCWTSGRAATFCASTPGQLKQRPCPIPLAGLACRHGGSRAPAACRSAGLSADHGVGLGSGVPGGLRWER
jgi:hypothetical protein